MRGLGAKKPREKKEVRKTEPNYKLYSSLADTARQSTRAEIDLGALRDNYRLLQAHVRAQNPSTRMISVVKADAYGHGAPACVRALLEEGCDFFAVSCIDEAVAVREICDTAHRSADILIFSYTDPAQAARLAHHNLIQTLLSEDYARDLEEEARKANVTVRTHVAVDTGMNRIGFVAHNESEALASAAAIARLHTLSHLGVEGMFTHFACSEEICEDSASSSTERQAARYRRLRAILEEQGTRIPFHHVCNSAAAVCRPADHFDGVRMGILLYSARPFEQIELPLKPVMRLKAIISHLHTLLPGESVGYGGRFVSNSERLIATLPIGYADGFLRAYRGAHVSLQTNRGVFSVPIVGNVCMDQCMLDVTDTGARIGDVVTLFGHDSGDLHRLATHASTIDYECLCLVSARVPRHYVEAETQND